MKFDSKCSKSLLDVYKRIVDALPLKKKGKPIGKIAEAINDLSYYASMGFPPAMVYLGQLYANGIYFRKNIDYALELFKKAAKCGYPLGYHRIATLILNNERSFPNLKNVAIRCYTKAFSLGYYKAGVDLAKYLINNDDSEYYDYKFAFNHLNVAWEKSRNLEARSQIALCYLKGIAVEKDKEKGEEMLKELITEYKSVEAALTWMNYADSYFSFSKDRIKEFVELIESNIPSIRTNYEYVRLKRSVVYF